MISAAALIILILALVGIGVGVYYACMCLSPRRDKSIIVDAEHGPLILQEHDVNGNREDLPASEVPVESRQPAVVALDEPDRRVSSDNENALPSADSVSIDLHGKPIIVPPHKHAGKQPKADSLLPIQEEPSAQPASSPHIEANPSKMAKLESLPEQSHSPHVKYISDTDAEDGLLQSRPQLDDSLEDKNNLIAPQPSSPPQSHKSKSVQDCPKPEIIQPNLNLVEDNSNVDNPSNYGWHSDVSAKECNPVVKDTDSLNPKSHEVINTEESPLKAVVPENNAHKIIIPSKIQAMPVVSCQAVQTSEFPSQDEPAVSLDEVTVTKPFYQPILTDKSTSTQDIPTDMVNKKVNDEDDSDKQKGNVDEAPQNIQSGDKAEKNVVKSNTSISTDSLSVEDNNAHSDSDDSSEPEITEYHFNPDTDQLGQSPNVDIVKDEVDVDNEVKVTNFVPIPQFVTKLEESPVKYSKTKSSVIQDISTVPNNAELSNCVNDKSLCATVISNSNIINSNNEELSDPNDLSESSSSSDDSSSESDVEPLSSVIIKKSSRV